MMYTIRSKDGEEAVYYMPSEYVALKSDHGGKFKLFETEDRSKAETVWMCFGGEYGDFEIAEE